MQEAAAETPLAQTMRDLMASPGTRAWLDAIFGNSPYLSRLALREPDVVATLAAAGPDRCLAQELATLAAAEGRQDRAATMALLRRAKRRAALAVGLADIAGLWPLERVTAGLSELADATLDATLRHLLRTAATAKQLRLDVAEEDGDPLARCGITVLGMGKLGARELNYSSDIDIIILFEPERLHYTGRDDPQTLTTRLARDLVKLMDERTGDGYVFRTDLRLRPDPSSTPPAISVAAAEGYYGSLGQNWERAAFIKARAVAGDLDLGRQFLKTLTPFIWRKHLDFAAIQDIHSIKRQIDARHGPRTGSRIGEGEQDVGGHNIKLGHGGIREIEFFAQTQQLIWGGRLPQLRTSGTIAALDALAEAGHLDPAIAAELAEAYGVLRQVEHRLQMIDDAQTHTLPRDPMALERLAVFLGYEDRAGFERSLSAVLDRVRARFRELFPEEQSLSGPDSGGGNLVFTGKDNDPETLKTLAELGFRTPERVAESLRAWHHGRIRATRSARAREILTELTPALLKALGRTADPDFTFARFDEFLGRLPAGVQLFSLFQHRPQLLKLVAEIMGEAPQLGAQLARRPLLLDAVLSGSFFDPLPEEEAELDAYLAADLRLALKRANDYQDVLDLTRRWASDRRFQLGVQILQERIPSWRAGCQFAAVARIAIASLLPHVEAEFARQHGQVEGGGFVVLGLGKLGSAEMNMLSDLDLIFVYEAPENTEFSDGRKPLAPTSYYARLGQRLIEALAALTGEGSLYEVDMRLRPSGSAGPIASSLDAFCRYHAEQAWTWERMALTRARVVAGPAALGRKVEAAIRAVLTLPRDAAALVVDVDDMRQRIERSHADPNVADAKHRPGGLVDLEFVAQYLQLAHGPARPGILAAPTAEAFNRLAEAGLIGGDTALALVEGLHFWQNLQGMLRVVLGKTEPKEAAPSLLDRALARAIAADDAETARAELDRKGAEMRALYERLVAEPAAGARIRKAGTNEEESGEAGYD